MPRTKDVLTTGEVARICSVAPRTVSKWFDSGQLGGYRIPGSKDRRIPMNSLMRFMKQHNIPMDGLSSGQTRVLLVDSERDLLDTLHDALADQTNYEVHSVVSGFAAGLECEKFRPHVILLDMHLPDADGKQILKHIRSTADMEMTRVVAVSGRFTDGQAQHLKAQGFDGFLRKPFSIKQVIAAIEDAVALVY